LSERKTKTKRTDRTRRTAPTKRSAPTKRITPTARTLTKDLEVMDYGAGEIETDEFAQTGLTKKGRLTNKAPIEAVSGVNAPKGKSLRKKGIENVGDLRKKSKSKKPVTIEPELNYYIFDFKSNSLLSDPYDSRKEAKNKIAFISKEKKGEFNIIPAENYGEARMKVMKSPVYQKALKDEKIVEDRRVVIDSSKYVQSSEFRVLYATKPTKAMKDLDKRLEGLDPKARDEFDEWFVDLDRSGALQSSKEEYYEKANRWQEDVKQEHAKTKLPPSKEGKLVQITNLSPEEKDIRYKGISYYYVFQGNNFEAMKFKDHQEAHNYKDTLQEPTAVVLDESYTKAATKAKQRLEVNKRLHDEVMEQKALREKVSKEEKAERSAEIKKRKDATALRDLHSTHAQDFELGEIYYYRWTNNFNQFEGKVKIVKINPKSVRIQLLDPPKGYKKGQNWNVRLVEQTKNNGLYTLTSDETSQVQDVASKQVNVTVTETQYKDRREFRNLGLVPDRDSDGKFVGWAGNIDPEDIPKLEELGNVVFVDQPITQKKVHLDEIARLNRQLDSLEEREFKKSKQYDQLSDEIKQGYDMIPAGQPILVGHHSEKRHRKHLEKLDNKERKRYELGQEIEKIQSQKSDIERRKKTMLGRKEKEYIKPTPQSYIAGHPELKRDLDHVIEKLPKDKSDAYNQKKKAQKVREKLNSKKSWSKTEIRDLLRSNNIYIDLENVSGKDNWIAEANKAIDNSISNQEREIKSISEFEYYVEKNTVESRLFFVTDNAVMYKANREQRISNMENQMEFWKLSKQKMDDAKTPEEVAHTEKHYFERMKVLHDEQIKLDKEKTTLDTRFFTDTRQLPSNMGGKIAYTATNDFAADSFLVHQRNDPRWKAIPREDQAKKMFKDQKEAVTKAQQKARVKQVKQAVVQKKLEPDDPKSVVAFQSDKWTWVLLPDGRFIRSSDRATKGFTELSENKYLKAMKEEELTAIYQNQDFSKKDRWFVAWAMIHGWGYKDFEKLKNDPQYEGTIMSRSGTTALLDETRSHADLSVHEGNYMEPQHFGTPKRTKYKNDENEMVDAYEIRKGLYYDKELVDQALALSEDLPKHYSKVIVKVPSPNAGSKPLIVYLLTTKEHMAIMIAATNIKDVDLEDFQGSDDFDDEEDDFITTVDSNPSQGAFAGDDNIDPNELAERIGREI